MANVLTELVQETYFFFIATGQEAVDSRNLSDKDATRLFDFISEELRPENLQRDGQESVNYIAKRKAFLLKAKKALFDLGFQDKQRN